MNLERHPYVTSERLVDLYNRTSKHGQYQLLASPLRSLVPGDKVRIQSRHETERLEFILHNIPWHGASVADIGSNTGFFSFELIARGAASVLCIEGNTEHADFVRGASNVLGWQDHITLLPEYLEFGEDLAPVQVDICLLMNVLHHVGDDFGNLGTSVEAAKNCILEILIRLARHTRFLVLQLGFNWKGSRQLPLFGNGTKEELIDFVHTGTKGVWCIRQIGIAQRSNGGIAYENLTPVNIQRDDTLGEFLNRPLFIMEAQSP